MAFVVGYNQVMNHITFKPALATSLVVTKVQSPFQIGDGKVRGIYFVWLCLGDQGKSNEQSVY
jgi:hypothetical protein